MGEATYYTKVYFNSPAEAEEVLPKMKEFFGQGRQAEDFWQANRGKERTDEEFWKEFDEKFPLVAEYLRDADLFGGDKNNGLAGKLDFGSQEEIDQMECSDGVILYNAYVWHFAEWDYLKRFVEKKFGASLMKWLSDEYIDPFELL